METRTKKLLTVLGIVAVIAAGFYAYKLYIAEKPAPPKVILTMGAPVPRKAVPAQVQPAASAPAAAKAPAVAAKRIIKVMEKGKEVQYSSPEDFVTKTSLSPLEAENFAKKRLEDAKKTLDAARAGKDKAAIAAAEAYVKESERLNSLVSARMKESQSRKAYVYSALGRRDPFMNPLEIPKVFPPIPLNAKPIEKVPIETITVKAIIWNQKGYRAMVVTPDGRSFTVKSGDRIGDKLGHITKITDKRIYVTEKIRDILGEIETKNSIIQLHHKEAE